MRRTKILATLGPASNSPEMIEKLIRAGMNAVRLNFSHGTYEAHEKVYRTVRETSLRLGIPVAVVQDLQGPKIRTGNMKDGKPITLADGQKFVITNRKIDGTTESVSTTYDALPSDVKPGDRILLDDGLLELRVVSKTATDVTTSVVKGGPLSDHKGINLPGVSVSAPSMSEKDIADAEFGLKLGVDYIALSFVRQASDIKGLRSMIENHGSDAQIISKIEKPEALDNLEAIMDATDGVMVARGDMGVELAVEKVPIFQKRIIALANQKGKLVITATQMLESMIQNQIPTRAEVTDVANAILDGTDVVMLSGETAKGRYPVEVVQKMGQIAVETEEHLLGLDKPEPRGNRRLDIGPATVEAAAEAAFKVGAKAILIFTMSGNTAFLISQHRPSSLVIAFTVVDKVANRMALYWGVQPMVIPLSSRLDDMLHNGEQILIEKGMVRDGDSLVFVAGTTATRGTTNTVKLHRVGQKDIGMDIEGLTKVRRRTV
jgi:pyruvate kinase